MCGESGRALAFVYPKRRLRVCIGCGGRFESRELVEVTEDREALAWFPGDELCRKCACAHGVL